MYQVRSHTILLLTLFSLVAGMAHATKVTGAVIDAASEPISFSSVYIKGSSKGTTANADGRFTLDLAPGTYTIICTHVGYKKEEQTIKVGTEVIDIFFRLYPQQTEMKDVVIKASAEDPAYAIIRNAIATREAHRNQVRQWQVDVYMKGLIRTLQVPKSIFGVKVNTDRNVIDSSGKGIIYLSESVTKYSRRMPDDYKEEILSAKVSGRSQGFGFNSPKTMELDLYENNISIQGMNSRGFVSPISDNALYFYRYKYEGTFYEDGVEVNKIRIIPKRKYEPCFAGGYINIIEGDWRIHGVDIFLTKESQIEIVDSLQIQQQMLPLGKGVWMPQQTSFFASFGMFGFKASANFTAVYSDYDVEHAFPKRFFGKVIRTADTSANKTSLEYWRSIRPVPLTMEEERDYLKKDTLEQRYKDPKYLDSLDKKRNQFKFGRLMLSGYSYLKRSKKISFSLPALINSISYNTVEGAVVEIAPTINHYGDTGAYTIIPQFRYGFANKRMQATLTINKAFGKNYDHRTNIGISGGRSMFQIDRQDPVTTFSNTVASLIYTSNLMKLYERTFLTLSASRNIADGLRANISMSWEKRHLPENADTGYTWVHYRNRRFTSNYPEEVIPGQFPDHKAFVTTVRLTWQPGQQYVEYPKRRFSIGSDWPVFSLTYTHGWKGVLGSDVDFDKWRFMIRDEVRLRLLGEFAYRVSLGGFIKKKVTFLPDWQHFLGNQSIQAGTYLQAFQLAPYFANSNNDDLYVSANLEHHFNGAITNKIPFIRKFNLGLVAGTNSFYVNKDKYYSEVFVGLENIFKILRADVVWGYRANVGRPQVELRLGFSGIFTGNGIE